MSISNSYQISAAIKSQTVHIPKVSIVLPIYNAGEYLRPCLDTLVHQTLQEIEIICVLDCPTDGSDKVVEEYAAKDGRITVIRNEHNLNIGESRNVGLRVARGEYIGFSDHDDTRELDMYERMYNASDNGRKNIVFSGILVESILNHEFPTYLHDLMSRINSLPVYQQLYYSLIPREGRNYRMHITPNLYNHRFITEHNLSFVDTRDTFAEDKLFLLSALAVIRNDDEVSLLNHKYYIYRLYDTNAHLSNWYFDRNHVINHIHYLYAIAAQTNWSDQRISLSVFPVLQISILYSCFRRDIKKFGAKHTFILYRTLICSDNILKEIINTTPFRTKGLSFLKLLFLIWLKHVSKQEN
jgi:glycosyltransferase involved in cell wall biosynthesis